jgi:hypothetical protein
MDWNWRLLHDKEKLMEAMKISGENLMEAARKRKEGLMKAIKISREKLMEATKMSRGTDGHHEDQRREPGGHKDEQRGADKSHEDEPRWFDGSPDEFKEVKRSQSKNVWKYTRQFWWMHDNCENKWWKPCYSKMEETRGAGSDMEIKQNSFKEKDSIQEDTNADSDLDEESCKGPGTENRVAETDKDNKLGAEKGQSEVLQN